MQVCIARLNPGWKLKIKSFQPTISIKIESSSLKTQHKARNTVSSTTEIGRILLFVQLFCIWQRKITLCIFYHYWCYYYCFHRNLRTVKCTSQLYGFSTNIQLHVSIPILDNELHFLFLQSFRCNSKGIYNMIMFFLFYYMLFYTYTNIDLDIEVWPLLLEQLLSILSLLLHHYFLHTIIHNAINNNKITARYLSNYYLSIIYYRIIQ